MPELDPDLETRFLRDGDAASFDRLVAAFWPLVLSICRATLRDEHEAEDAAQETFLKLLNRRHQIRGRLGGWLTTVAQTTSLDRLRQRGRQHDRHVRWHQQQPALFEEGRARIQRYALQARLPDALLELDTLDRDVLTHRLLLGEPLRTIARRFDLSLATASRRVNTALDTLRQVYLDLGVIPADATETFDIDELLSALGPEGRAYFRDNHVWYGHQPNSVGDGVNDPPNGDDPAPRPLRVGVLFSRHALVTPSEAGHIIMEEEPGFMLRSLEAQSVELVSLIDPGSADTGIVERLMRDYDVRAGLAYATDLTALQTLDVILVGMSFSLPPEVLATIHAAVRSGVGLLNDGWLTDEAVNTRRSDQVLDLCLSAGRSIGVCRPAKHHFKNPGHIVRRHPATPTLHPGDTFKTFACGGWHRPRPDAQVIAVRGPGDVDDPPERPCLVAGTCGKGRVLYFDTVHNFRLIETQPDPGRVIRDMLDWLGGRSATSLASSK